MNRCPLAVAIALLAGCSDPPAPTTPTQMAPCRFTKADLGDGVYLLTDSASGKQYLTNLWRGGFIEVAAQPAEAK